MGKVTGNWVTGAHSGRACKHDNIYTKVDKKTGKCYSVKVCNPNSDWSEDQEAQRSEFGKISKAIALWIRTNKETSGTAHADYVKVKKIYDRQNRYSTLRGMMYGKGMYTISGGTVTVDITARTIKDSSSTGGDDQNGDDEPMQ